MPGAPGCWALQWRAWACRQCQDAQLACSTAQLTAPLMQAFCPASDSDLHQSLQLETWWSRVAVLCVQAPSGCALTDSSLAMLGGLLKSRTAGAHLWDGDLKAERWLLRAGPSSPSCNGGTCRGVAPDQTCSRRITRPGQLRFISLQHAGGKHGCTAVIRTLAQRQLARHGSALRPLQASAVLSVPVERLLAGLPRRRGPLASAQSVHSQQPAVQGAGMT